MVALVRSSTNTAKLPPESHPENIAFGVGRTQSVTRMGVFVLSDSQGLVALTPSEFVNEDDFQRLLEKYPALLFGTQADIETTRRWLLIKREKSIPAEDGGSGRWSVDHLFVDQDGIPTLVEVKRQSDTRLRREVVGQMLDYAANAVVYWPVEQLRAEFEQSCAANGTNPEKEIRDRLALEGDAELLWQRVKTNLQAGRSASSKSAQGS